MKLRFLIAIIFCLLICICYKAIAQIQTNEKIKIKILHVFDGDTVKAQTENGNVFNLRLDGIDCFEVYPIKRAYKQAYLEHITIEEVVERGIKSTKILEEFLKNTNCETSYVSLGKDKYNRELGILYCGETNINEYMKTCGDCMEYNFIPDPHDK